MAGLCFEAVDKRYGAVEALRGFELDIEPGEAMAIVGPSGSGKTTALRVAAGLDAVSAGRIVIGGRDVTAAGPAERNVSMVFQSYALFPHLSVADNIGFGLRVRKVARATARELVEGVAKVVGCADLLDRRPSQLSGGERQRVALARALVRKPDVFLLDEPLSSLDAQLRVQMRNELHRLHRSLDTTMLHVTHDQSEALTLGDRVAVVDGGVVQQVATPVEIYWRPANLFVANFIGAPSINVFPADQRAKDVHAGPFTVPLPSDMGGIGPEIELQLGIRPEHVAVAGLHDTIPGGTEAAVSDLLTVGGDTFLSLDVPSGAGSGPGDTPYDGPDGAGRATGRTELTARVATDRLPAVGDRVQVILPADRVYLFDGRSGRTICFARHG